MKFLVLGLMLVYATNLHALSLRDTASVWVNLDDSARGGCWTNIQEVREYTEGSVINKGGRLIPEDQNSVSGMILENHTRILISVTASRLYADGSGPCIGNVTVRLDGLLFALNEPAWAVVKEQSIVHANDLNFNRIVLDNVSVFFQSYINY